MESAGYNQEYIPLQDWYSSLQNVKSTRDNYFLTNAISLLGLILANFGALGGMEYSGIEIDKQFVLPSLFLLYSISGMSFSYFNSKVSRYENIFHSIYDRSSHAAKFDLILRYPESFNALQFNPFIAGNPKHMFTARDYPIRLMLLILLILTLSIPLILINLWIISISTIAIYNTNFPSGSWTGISINIACWAALTGSALLITPMLKRKYFHYGLVNLLQKAKPIPEKHARMIRRINRVTHPNLFRIDMPPSRWSKSGVNYEVRFSWNYEFIRR